MHNRGERIGQKHASSNRCPHSAPSSGRGRSIRTRCRPARARLRIQSGIHGPRKCLSQRVHPGSQPKEIERRYEDIAAFAEIGSFIDQPVKTYSSGMTVRLAFAVAIHVDPEILLVDEALAVGDIYFRQRCMRKVHELRSSRCNDPICVSQHGRREGDWRPLPLARSRQDSRAWPERHRRREVSRCHGREGFGISWFTSRGCYPTPVRLAAPPEVLDISPTSTTGMATDERRITGIAVYDEFGRETPS